MHPEVTIIPTPLRSLLVVRQIVLDGSRFHLSAEGQAVAARCPSCRVLSSLVHARYTQRPVDRPWRGHTVRLTIRVRRFRCSNAAWARSTFAEDVGERLPRYTRRTAETARHLLAIACAVRREAGARVATSLGLPVSPDTLLRLLRRAVPSVRPALRVLGVDDLALQRRHRYATLLVDLETRRPVDLLAERDADDLVSWLATHPGVNIVVRDRSDAYAERTTAGAPDAQQVAHRFHLVQNATTALEEVLRGRRRRIEVVAAAAETPSVASPAKRPVSPSRRQIVARRQARVARWETVRRLREGGGTSAR